MANGGTGKGGAESDEDVPFWRSKTLEAMSEAEWESLCDGCGRCCLIKLEDEDTGRYHFTDVACQLFEEKSCSCRDYPSRDQRVPDCVRLDPSGVRTLGWLPVSCAYRLVAEGRDLYWWHPLVSGDRETVHAAGVSVRGKVAALEDEVPTDSLPDYIVTWPTRLPPGAARGRRREKK
jgi:uncharacterized cysteine cluster protein YcgN (CxxCxxCC family)